MSGGSESESKRILVTGATGWLGRAICDKLQEQGHEVVAADLKAQSGPWSAFLEINLCAEPIASVDSTASILQERPVDGLIHCAGYAHRPIETPEEIERFHAINAEGTRRTINWAKEMEIPRFVYLSSIAFYDWEALNGRPAHEDSPLASTTAYAASKLAGEKAVVDSGMDYCVVRLATVFGEGDRANFAKLAAALKAGRFIVPGKGEAKKSVISVDRAAEYIARLAFMPGVSRQILNLGFGQPASLAEIRGAFSAVCGFPDVRQMPLSLMKACARFGDIVARIKPNFPLTTTNVSKLTRSTQVDTSGAIDLFPELGRLTFEEELKRCADYYRDL